MTPVIPVIIGMIIGLAILKFIKELSRGTGKKINFHHNIKKYLVEVHNPIKTGDLVKSDNPACDVSVTMLVLEENIWGPRFHDGVYSKGFLVLANNRKMFIAMEDCYKVVETN